MLPYIAELTNTWSSLLSWNSVSHHSTKWLGNMKHGRIRNDHSSPVMCEPNINYYRYPAKKGEEAKEREKERMYVSK